MDGPRSACQALFAQRPVLGVSLQGSRTHMVFAAVFPQVHEGSYSLWADAPGPIAELTVVGGQVCTLDVTEGEPTC